MKRTSLYFTELCLRTAHLVALWQMCWFLPWVNCASCYYFYTSVLNTDNMSIIGLTIDYGPFGFLDRYYNPGHICNKSGQL